MSRRRWTQSEEAAGRFVCRVALLLLTAILAIAAPVAAQEAKQRQYNLRPAAYGKTPDTVIPFRDFKEPYYRFFQKVYEFRGPGREAEPAVLPSAVRIGFMGPIGDAPDSDIGEQMLEGVQLALEQANVEGGYKGIPLELVIRPDTGLWGATSNEMVAFTYEDDVLAVIGSIDGANTHIALRVALKTETPIVNTGDTDPTLTETNIPWIIRCIADDRQQGYALAHHIFNECGIEKVAAFRVNDRYGRVGIAEFRDAARRLKHPLRVELRWNRGDRDFTAELDRIAETEPEAIVIWGNASDAAAVVREIRKRKMNVRIFGCDRLASSTFLAEAGEAAEGIVAVATFDPTRDDLRLVSFFSQFQERFGHRPDAYAAHGFDGACILIEAIREAGLNRVRVRDALFSLNRYDGVTGSIEFDTTLNDIGSVFLAEVRDGKFHYREAQFAKAAKADPVAQPYRTMAQSPPAARSPAVDLGAIPTSYRIGCFLPLDQAGQSVVNGARMALADDSSAHPDGPPIILLVRDARGAWGSNSKALVDLVFDEEVIALLASTERRGTHLAETIAAKIHLPVLSFCDSDPTITQIPLPWVFQLAPAGSQPDPRFARRYHEQYGDIADSYSALGYDAGLMLVSRIRGGARNRSALRDKLADQRWFRGVSGDFRFDPLGNRVEAAAEVATEKTSSASYKKR